MHRRNCARARRHNSTRVRRPEHGGGGGCAGARAPRAPSVGWRLQALRAPPRVIDPLVKSWIQAANHMQLRCTINLEYHMLIIITNLIIINRVSEDELLQVRSIHHCELLYHTHPEE